MNKEGIISQGNELLKIIELAVLRERFEVWKDTVLDYARYDNDFLIRCKMQLHVGDTAFLKKLYVERENRREKKLLCLWNNKMI